jgi:hypothetical protein
VARVLATIARIIVIARILSVARNTDVAWILKLAGNLDLAWVPRLARFFGITRMFGLTRVFGLTRRFGVTRSFGVARIVDAALPVLAPVFGRVVANEGNEFQAVALDVWAGGKSRPGRADDGAHEHR